MNTAPKIAIGTGVILLGIGLGLYLARKRIYATFDYKTNVLLLTLDPMFRKKVKRFLKEAKKEGMELRVISGYRDCDEQNKLYAQGRSAKGEIVTNARCGKSAHNYKVAVDVVEFKEGKPLWKNPNWERIGQLGEKAGMEWGGRWKSFVDKPHFQDLKGRTMADLYRAFQETGELTV